VIAALGLLFAAMTAAGAIGALLLLLLVLSIMAHVAGNVIGTRLRTIGSTPDPAEKGVQRRPPRVVFQHEYAPATALCRRTAMSRMMIGATITGAVICGACGGAVLIWLTWGEVNLPTALVAVGSSTVLGGFLGFMTSSFTQIAGGAWREAGRGKA
jgi:hypothetical protein